MFLPFDPQKAVVERNFSKVLWLELAPRSHVLSAKQIAERLARYGDFTVLKDTRGSAFVEVVYIGMVQPDIDAFVASANQEIQDLGVFRKFQEAKRFKAKPEVLEQQLAGEI